MQLRAFVLAYVSNELLPKRRFLIKAGSQRCWSLLSMFSMVLWRVRLPVICVRQWRRKCTVDSLSQPKLRNEFKEFWKLCLNLCSLKQLKANRSLVTNLIPLGLWQLKRLLADGVIDFRYFSSKYWNCYSFLCYDQVYSIQQ